MGDELYPIAVLIEELKNDDAQVSPHPSPLVDCRPLGTHSNPRSYHLIHI